MAGIDKKILAVIKKVTFTREQKIIAAVGAIVVICGLLYNFLYQPLLKKIKITGLECRRLETDLMVAQNKIASAKPKTATKAIISENEISIAIDVITKAGKSKGIDFMNIKANQAQEQKEKLYKIVPVEMQVEAPHGALSDFLAALDDTDKALIEVGSFKIVPKEGNPDKLMADITLEVYVAAE